MSLLDKTNQWIVERRAADTQSGTSDANSTSNIDTIFEQ